MESPSWAEILHLLCIAITTLPDLIDTGTEVQGHTYDLHTHGNPLFPSRCGQMQAITHSPQLIGLELEACPPQRTRQRCFLHVLHVCRLALRLHVVLVRKAIPYLDHNKAAA